MENLTPRSGPSFYDLPETTRFMVGNSPYPIFLIDFKSQDILDCNEAAIKQFEYQASEFSGLSLSSIKQNPERKAKVKTQSREKLDRKPSVGTRRYYTKSGKSFEAIDNWQLADPKETSIYLLQLQTITPDLASKSEDQERKIFLVENSHDLMWASDLRLKFTFATQSIQDLLGYTRKEWVGSLLYSHCSRKEFIKMARISVNSIKNYKEFKHIRFEAKLRHKNGNEILVEIIAKLIINKFGLPIGWHGTTRDITEVRKVRLELAREKAQLLSLIDHLPERVYFKDRESRFLIANKAVAEHIGIDDQAKLIGKTDLDFYPKKHAKQYRIDEQNIMDSQHGLINYEERVKNPDGKLGWTLTSKIPIIDVTGDVIGLVGISRDISETKRNQVELRKAKEIAEQSNNLKVNFIANVSHEIRTPLNAILGFSHLMKDEFEETGNIESAEHFEIITNAGDRLMRTVDMILNLSRIETGEIKIHPVNIEIVPTIRQLEREYELRAKQKNLDLIFDIESNRKNIFSDEYALTHSFSNLIDNAIKYTNEGFIKVSVRDEKNGDLSFIVEDSGIGVGKDYIKNLFEPYTQEETGFAKKHEGIGLGLSLTLKLVTMANGTISVSSEKNQGSTFILSFPDLSPHKT